MINANVAQCAIVVVDHAVKCQSIYAYVTLLLQHESDLGSAVDYVEVQRKNELTKEVVEACKIYGDM